MRQHHGQIAKIVNDGKMPNKTLQLTSNTPLRFVLRSTELKRYINEQSIGK